MASLPPERMAYPGVAVGVIVTTYDDSATGKTRWRTLLGKRKGPLGTGMYSLPGGKVDFGEDPVATAIREVKEETGLDIDDVSFTGKVSNDYFPEKGKHFINLFYIGRALNPQDLYIPESEKEKFEEWQWHDPFNLPEGTWMHTGQVISAYFAHSLTGLYIPGVDGK